MASMASEARGTAHQCSGTLPRYGSALSRFAQQQAMILTALYRVSFRFQPISLARLASSPAEGERRLGCLRLASPALPVPQNVRLVALLSNAER